MLHEPPEMFALTHPASLWTGPVKVRFLDCLAQRGNVRLAARQVGLSAETAYRQRRRDAVFARAWAAAMALARRASEQVLAERAIDGVEEQVWYRGEVVGTRVRYDTRLLLAHLARLDKMVDGDAAAEADTARFDELLAVIAGADTAGLAEPRSDPLPPEREAFAAQCARQAVHVVDTEWAETDGDDGRFDDELCGQYWTERAQAEAGGWLGGEAQWDDWTARAHRAVDAALAETPPAEEEEDASPPGPCQRRQHPGPDEAVPDPVDREGDASPGAAAHVPPEQAPSAVPPPASPAPVDREAPPEAEQPRYFRPVRRPIIQLAET